MSASNASSRTLQGVHVLRRYVYVHIRYTDSRVATLLNVAPAPRRRQAYGISISGSRSDGTYGPSDSNLDPQPLLPDEQIWELGRRLSVYDSILRPHRNTQESRGCPDRTRGRY